MEKRLVHVESLCGTMQPQQQPIRHHREGKKEIELQKNDEIIQAKAGWMFESR